MEVTFRTAKGTTTVEIVTPLGARFVGRLDGVRVVDLARPGGAPVGRPGEDLASLWHRIRNL